MADVLDFTGKTISVDKETGDLTPTGKAEALEMIQKCVTMLQGKIDSGDMFDKDKPTMDYFAGSIKMVELSFTLQTMIHKIHADSLTTMEEYD
jgi:hypothetical protein